jgi:hypothetical protein
MEQIAEKKEDNIETKFETKDHDTNEESKKEVEVKDSDSDSDLVDSKFKRSPKKRKIKRSYKLKKSK